MFELRFTEAFQDWYHALRDEFAQARIARRLERMTSGNLGDVKPIGEGVSEARIDYGPGYRLYFVRRGRLVVVLLCGGSKGTQAKDIKTALKLAREL
jgi:putative addiction module killer protein